MRTIAMAVKFSCVRDKLILVVAAGDVELWLLLLHTPLQCGDGEEHGAGEEDHGAGEVEAGVIVAQQVVQGTCRGGGVRGGC